MRLSSASPRHNELARGRLHCDTVPRLGRAGLAFSIPHVLAAEVAARERLVAAAAGETWRAQKSSFVGVLAPHPASPALLGVLSHLKHGNLAMAEAAGPPQACPHTRVRPLVVALPVAIYSWRP